jgi:AcrR family transcriptional regulator
MTSRAESSAATRSALLQAASELLDEGGPDAVTLREVGARAGVSRGAPYGHFADKEDLLAVLAIDSWRGMAHQLRQVAGESGLSPRGRLRRALSLTLGLARGRPHLYALMFVAPSREPQRLIDAAAEAQDEFLGIVAGIIGPRNARPRGALLLSSTHGIAGMELAGQLSHEKWATTSEQLLDVLIDLVGGEEHPASR